MAKREIKNPVVTDMKRKFVDGLFLGLNPVQAAQAAGSKDPQQRAWALQQDPWVVEKTQELEAIRRREAKITREQVQDIVLDAVDMAKVIASPGDMIRGAAELNKMCGFYAPEETKVSIDGELRVVQEEFEQMSERELLEAAGKEMDDIEGEFEVLNAEGL